MAKVRFDGDASSVVREQDRMSAGQQKVNNEFREAAKRAKEFERELEQVARNEKKSLEIALEAGRRRLEWDRKLMAAAREKAREEEAGQKKAAAAEATAAQQRRNAAALVMRAHADEKARLTERARVIREQLNPQEKLNRLTVELATLVRRGNITIDEATQAHRRWRNELGLAATEANKAGEANESAFGTKALNTLTSYFLGMASVGGAISLIRSELDAIAKIDERAAQRIRDAANPDAALRRVIAQDPNRQAVLDTVEQVASDRSLPVNDVKRAATAAYGATGSADITNRSLSEAFSITRDPEVATQTARGIGFILQSTELKDTKEARGLLELVLALSPVEDSKVPQQLPKVASKYTSPTAGGSVGTGAALLSFVSQAAGDVEGERTRTGVIELEEKLDKFFDKNRKKFGLIKEASDGIDEQLGFLFAQGNEAAAERFIKATKFAAPVSGGFSRVFLDEEFRQKFREEVPRLNSREARLQAARDSAEFTLGGDIQQGALTQAAVASEVERLDLDKAALGLLTDERVGELVSTIAEARRRPIAAAKFSVAYGSGFDGTTRSEAIGILQHEQSLFGAPVNEAQRKAQNSLNRMLTKLEAIERNQRSRITTLPNE